MAEPRAPWWKTAAAIAMAIFMVALAMVLYSYGIALMLGVIPLR